LAEQSGRFAKQIAKMMEDTQRDSNATATLVEDAQLVRKEQNQVIDSLKQSKKI
jgi:hypothetical protein